ncbi:MAG: primosomal protein N' [Streptococcaceae bacterium]|jgi:primosomal protein N' (replication factor Y)|nr:primosomal protein N' [Streptococcaceae bacterium]
MYAHVIVDVPAFQTNHPYTYLIPEQFKEVLVVGMRVSVPFGKSNRLVQGFVVDILPELKEVDFAHEIKEIQALLDVAAVLNQELLQLADYMMKITFAFKIYCLQTMLPSILRVDYAKYLVRTDGKFFANAQSKIAWEDAKNQGLLPQLIKEKAQGLIDVCYEVNKRNKAKTERFVNLSLTKEELNTLLKKQRTNAKQKILLLKTLLTLKSEISLKELKNLGLKPATLKIAKKSGWVYLIEKEVYRNPFMDTVIKPVKPLTLNEEQALVKQKFVTSMQKKEAKVYLLEGITGSGKTEIYLQTIAECLKKGKTAMMLVPEIALTPQMIRRFRERFEGKIAVLHSALSFGERYDQWRKIERKKAPIVIGARSAVFAPLKNIGIIILDEEHEGTYKQDKNPRYHTRDIAIWRGEFHHCPIVLGSATPSLESRARAQKKIYELVRLTKRAKTSAFLPKVEIVDFRKVLGRGGSQNFTPTLLEKIKERIAKNEQVVLLLNRRGYSSFMMCRDCGYVLQCPNCDISLTLHMVTKTMKCHYCGHEEGLPINCSNCKSTRIRYHGTGTQKVEEELQRLISKAKILRMDQDNTRKKGAYEKFLKQFANHKFDILLGTQMIAKGLDFENVTLVGVLNADTALNLPDFRASEKTFQLLIQVSGRAGRGVKLGEVVIQTYNPEHYAIFLAKNHDYETFFKKEMQMRYLADYPPFYYMVQLTVSHKDENEVVKQIYRIAKVLQKRLSAKTKLLGPVPKTIMRVNNRYYYRLLIKYKQESKLSMWLKQLKEAIQKENTRGLMLEIDSEPQGFM